MQSCGGAEASSISIRLPGGNSSLGISVNNAGQVVGFSDNGIPDPFANFSFQAQHKCESFLWEDGNMEDIGTLGGPDAAPGPDAITSVPE